MSRNGLITRAEAARLLGLSPQTLAHWGTGNKHLRYVRIGGPRGRVRYHLADVEAFIAAGGMPVHE